MVNKKLVALLLILWGISSSVYSASDCTAELLGKIKRMPMKNSLIINQQVMPVEDEKIIRVMSYNIRMAPMAADDGNENAWVYRLPKVTMIFNQYTPDIIGIQEMSDFQLQDLRKAHYLLPYNFIGGRPTKDPIEAELGIFYNTQKLEMISELHTVWLNECQVHPPAAAWDASRHPRYAIYAKFRQIQTGKIFWFINTHFDHLGVKARQESGKIIMNVVADLDAPAIVTGDFNNFPQLGGLELYQLLCTYSGVMQDSGVVADRMFSKTGSWMGWDYDPYKQRGGEASTLDYIFVNKAIEVAQHGIIDDYVWDIQFNKALYPSDHRPVISDVYL